MSPVNTRLARWLLLGCVGLVLSACAVYEPAPYAASAPAYYYPAPAYYYPAPGYVYGAPAVGVTVGGGWYRGGHGWR